MAFSTHMPWCPPIFCYDLYKLYTSYTLCTHPSPPSQSVPIPDQFYTHPTLLCTLTHSSHVYPLRQHCVPSPHSLSPLHLCSHLCCSECIVCRVCRVHCTPHTYASGVLLSFVMTCINYTLHTLCALTPLHPPEVSQSLINSTLTLHYYTLSLSPSSPALLGLVPPLKT